MFWERKEERNRIGNKKIKETRTIRNGETKAPKWEKKNKDHIIRDCYIMYPAVSQELYTLVLS